jgi:transcriptional regulator with XRE-family HTH domain
MEINLGLKIRELRKKHNLTQEDLAAKLSVSAQAISKWENNTCYPDMVQIPILANFFGVSLDELFSYDVTQLNHRIDGIIAEANKYFWENPNKCKEIYQSALKEYPSNERLLTELLGVCITHGTHKEALPIAERLVEEAKDVFSVCRAKASLVELYLRENRYDGAKKVIESLP